MGLLEAIVMITPAILSGLSPEALSEGGRFESCTCRGGRGGERRDRAISQIYLWGISWPHKLMLGCSLIWFGLSFIHFLLPKLSFPEFRKAHLISVSSSALKSLPLLAATSLSFAPPSLAVEIEKAALFDFNLTLPIMMVQFLLLMVALDKVYFSPLGKFMDERDAAIREKLSSVQDTSAEVKQLDEQAAAIMKAARAEISAALNKMKKETQAEVEKNILEGRKKVEAELQEALGNLEKQKEETIKALDSQIKALSDEIVKKVLPI